MNPKSVQRLIGFGGTLEEFLSLPQIITFENAVVDVDDDTKQQQRQIQIHCYNHLLLLCVHSHARFTGNASVSNIHSMYGPAIPMTIISLPCCPKFRSSWDIGRPPDIQYDMMMIVSFLPVDELRYGILIICYSVVFVYNKQIMVTALQSFFYIF